MLSLLITMLSPVITFVKRFPRQYWDSEPSPSVSVNQRLERLERLIEARKARENGKNRLHHASPGFHAHRHAFRIASSDLLYKGQAPRLRRHRARPAAATRRPVELDRSMLRSCSFANTFVAEHANARRCANANTVHAGTRSARRGRPPTGRIPCSRARTTEREPWPRVLHMEALGTRFDAFPRQWRDSTDCQPEPCRFGRKGGGFSGKAHPPGARRFFDYPRYYRYGGSTSKSAFPVKASTVFGSLAGSDLTTDSPAVFILARSASRWFEADPFQP